jgi:hypothetical protein
MLTKDQGNRMTIMDLLMHDWTCLDWTTESKASNRASVDSRRTRSIRTSIESRSSTKISMDRGNPDIIGVEKRWIWLSQICDWNQKAHQAIVEDKLKDKESGLRKWTKKLFGENASQSTPKKDVLSKESPITPKKKKKKPEIPVVMGYLPLSLEKKAKEMKEGKEVMGVEWKRWDGLQIGESFTGDAANWDKESKAK